MFGIDTSALSDKIKGFVQHLGGGRASGERPARAVWLTLLGVTVVLNVLVVAGCAYLFFQISEGEIFVVDSDEQINIETLSREELQGVLDQFAQQEQRFNRLQETEPEVPDPSI